MITYHQAAELKRRIEDSLDAAWDAGIVDGVGKPYNDAERVGAIERSVQADDRVFRYINHLAGVRSKKSKKR